MLLFITMDTFLLAIQSNHRVQVLNADLTYSHCFGSKGAINQESFTLHVV